MSRAGEELPAKILSEIYNFSAAVFAVLTKMEGFCQNRENWTCFPDVIWYNIDKRINDY